MTKYENFENDYQKYDGIKTAFTLSYERVNIKSMATIIITRTLKALANKRRLEILETLEKKGPLSVGDVAEEVGVSFRTTSKHLHQLAASELVERKQHGRSALYALNRVHPLLRKLREDIF